MSKAHELKVCKRFFVPLAYGNKTFEVRYNDRCFSVGDLLVLSEVEDDNGEYTGRFVYRVVTYVLDDKDYCVDGYVILALRRISIT